MSDSLPLQLNLRESSVYSDNDDDEFQSVSSSIGEDNDTYRVLDEALIGSRYLYGPEHVNKFNRERRFVEQPENSKDSRPWRPVDHFKNTESINPLLPERLEETADTKMLEAMNVLPVREMEELRQERDYQLHMKKRISDEMRRDNNYSMPRMFESDDNNNNDHTNYRDDHLVEQQIGDIDFNRQNPIETDNYTEEDNLYDSLEAEQPIRMQEYRNFPPSSNPLQPAFNDGNLDQFYTKSPQKELKSTGPVKADHMIFSQMWSDEQLYHEFEKMANDYNKNQNLPEPNFAYPPNQQNEHYTPPPVPDFQGSNPPDYQQSPREKLWNNLSNKQPVSKQNPIPMDFIWKPKAVPKISTNYVEYNKVNYGKLNQNQSYMDRHHLRKDISGSLSKLPSERKVYSGRSEPIHGTEQRLMPLLQKPSSAEDSWKKRSVKLIYQMEKKLPPPPGKLQKYPSDSRVNYRNSRPHYLQPLKQNVPPSGALVPVDQRSGMSSPSVIDLEPISKDFVMDDGQRISVDISLKLLSPPVSSRIAKKETNTGSFHSQLTPYYANEQAHQATNFKKVAATNSKEEQDSFSLQCLPDPMQPDSMVSDYQGPNNTEAVLNGKVGYAARYQRQRDPKPNYKVYSVDDYRRMQKEVKLGRLGPDLDSETLREKVEKRQKQFEYAKKVYETNKESLKSLKPAAPPQPQNFITEEQQNRRKLAIEYARSVPKPLAKPTVEGGGGNMPQELPPLSSQNQLPSIVPPKSKNTKSKSKLLDCEELEKLCLRHEQDKRNAENIRKKITPT